MKKETKKMKKLLIFSAAAGIVFLADAATLGTYSGTVPATDTVLFTGMNLVDVKSVSAWVTGDAMGTAGKSAPATAYYYSNDGTTLTVQFQVYLGDYTKGVVLQLTQEGADIKGKTLYARYFNDQYHNHEGTDMSSGWSNGGYKICNVTLTPQHGVQRRVQAGGGEGGVARRTRAEAA